MKQTIKAPPPPCILGIVTADMLARNRYPDALWRCGGVELRVDGLEPDAVPAAVTAFHEEKTRRGFTGPVVFTVRLQRDGGAWPDAGAASRNALWTSLPPHTCDWVDLEIEEITRPGRIPPQTLNALRSSGARILLSHHAFAFEEASSWETMRADMRTFAPDGVKFAVMPDAAQVPALLEFARAVAAEFRWSCVLGMGAGGAVTRVLGPLLGCPLTYGFLGEGAVAPGQLSVGVMTAFFERAATDVNRPVAEAPAEEWVAWAEALLRQVAGA